MLGFSFSLLTLCMVCVITHIGPLFSLNLFSSVQFLASFCWHIWHKINFCRDSNTTESPNTIPILVLISRPLPYTLTLTLESRQEQWTPSTRDTHKETGDPAQLPSLIAGQWGHRNWNSERRGKKYFVVGRLEQPSQNKNLLYRHDKPSETTKEGPLSFSFTSISTVSRGHPSIISLPSTPVPTHLILKALYSFSLRSYANSLRPP